MTIKLPVTADHNFIVDADQIPVAVAIQNPENGELDLSTAYARAADIVAALNATATTLDWSPPEPPLSLDMPPGEWMAVRDAVWQRHRKMFIEGGPAVLDDALQYLRDEITLEHQFNSTGVVLWDALNMVERALRSKTPAPDLTALRKAVEAWRFVCDRYDRELEGYGMVQSAEHDVIIAADILFQKDGPR